MRPTYTNPLYPASLPDPYVLKHQGEYWAYGSERSADGRYFKILHSPDLLHWQETGGALDEQPGGYTCYWAPEVVVWDSTCYLYYSLGNETRMTIRVASAGSPAGPFVDSGRSLTQELFAIDAHVFEDEDGMRYLFYAADFYDHPRAGTGTVMDRLLDPFTLAGSPRPVTRARFDWQIFDPHRKEKGGLRWHTLEGPFVLKHKGRYFQMFSGGNWQNISYGVSYATSPSLDNLEEWEQACDGQQDLPILRSLPEQGIVGPGHNSAVRGPDNRQWFCVYHRWAPTANGPQRVMAADRLEFIGDRLAVLGPSNTPQPAPIPPTHTFFTPSNVHAAGLPAPWQVVTGSWKQVGGAALPMQISGGAEAAWDLPASAFLLELSLRPGEIAQTSAAQTAAVAPGCGLRLQAGEHQEFRLLFLPGEQRLQVETAQGVFNLPLRSTWSTGMDRRLRLELNQRWVSVSLDGSVARWQGSLAASPTRMALLTRGMIAAFSAGEWTAGWEDRFDSPGCDLDRLGWVEPDRAGAWSIQAQQLCALPGAQQPARLQKALPAGELELVVNARLDCTQNPDQGYGFGPLAAPDGQPLCSLVRTQSGWALASAPSGSDVLPLPPEFDPSLSQQFRLYRQGGQWVVSWQTHLLGSLPSLADDPLFGLCTGQACAWFDLVRVTVMPEHTIGASHAAT